jgi:hypothetical protein
MKPKLSRLLTSVLLCLILFLTPLAASAQGNKNTKGEMKEGGMEVKRAGKSMGHNMRHGRVVRAGKHFGKHFGRAGKHFGRGTKKAVKHAVS